MRPGRAWPLKTRGRKRTPQGNAVIARNLHELEAAEARVNEIYFAWRAGRPTPLDEELDSMLDRWCAVPDPGDLVVEWVIERPSRRSRRSRACRRRSPLVPTLDCPESRRPRACIGADLGGSGAGVRERVGLVTAMSSRLPFRRSSDDVHPRTRRWW